MDLTPDPTKARLLGFAIRDPSFDGGPVSLIPVEPGMTVMYGLNGAGKTRILNGITAFFDGVQSDAYALVQLPQTFGRRIDRWDEHRPTAQGADWPGDWDSGVMLGEHADPEDVLSAWADLWFSSVGVSDDLPLYPPPDDWDRSITDDELGRGLHSEWSSTRLVMVRACGSDTNPQWLTCPALLAGDGNVFSDRACAMARLFEENRDDEALWENMHAISVERYATTGTGRVVLAATRWGDTGLAHGYNYPAGQHRSLIPMVPTFTRLTDDITAATKEALTSGIKKHVTVVGGKAVPSGKLRSRIRVLEDVANRHFRDAMLDAPQLRLGVNVVGLDAGAWWSANGRALSTLSRAQTNWAMWSIHQSLRSVLASEGGQFLLLDEPETGLHRAAESRMARYINALSRTTGTSLLVASHSPALLDLQDAHLMEISTEAGDWGRTFRRATPLSSVARDDLERLGLTPSDLLARQQGFVLVEGEHDLVILRTLLGEALLKLRTEILTLRGITYLSAPRIRFLYDYTPAHVFLMLDNLKTDELAQTWRDATDLVLLGDTERAVARLEGAACLGQPTEEARVLRELLQAEVTNGTSQRLTPHGLSKADIIEYLPVRAFVASAESWVSLRTAHAEARASGKNTPKDFKAWLRVQHQADTSIEAVTAAARMMDEIPRDLQRLVKTIEATVSTSAGPADLSEM